MKPALIAADIIAWPILQMATAWVFTRIPMRSIGQSNAFTHVASREAQFYRQGLQLNRWKHRLPDGAGWVGGSFRKSKLLKRDPAYLAQFAVETWRGELAHWMMLLYAPIFFVWNPLWADGVMIAYACLSNIPCILVQRYNRYTLLRVLERLNKQG